MRWIQKQREPAILTEYRNTPGAHYDGDSGFPAVKDAIRKALVKEQRGLCCYCERRISANADSMRIEHRIPQSAAPSRDLDWSNLLAACTGNEGRPEVHCDVAKKDQEISLNPCQKTHCETLTFSSGARLSSSSSEFQSDIDDVLHLNEEHLCRLRQQALEAYIKVWFQGRPSVHWKVLVRMRDALEGQGQLPPYASFLKSWLTRQIRQH